MANEGMSRVSRRDFIKGTGFVVGGAAIGSSVLGVACAPAAPGEAPPTGQAEPTTTTTTKYVCPYDNQQFGTLDQLKSHLNAVHGGQVPGVQLTKFKVNGTEYALKVEDYWTLAYVLRVKLGMVGTKVSCDEGICGFCTVMMDGRATYSCMTLASEVAGAEIMTVEGLDDKLYNVQRGFAEEHGFQCSFCTSGQIMSARALLEKNTNPTRTEVKLALSGNLCLCSNYEMIADSVLNAAAGIRNGVARPKPAASKYATAPAGA